MPMPRSRRRLPALAMAAFVALMQPSAAGHNPPPEPPFAPDALLSMVAAWVALDLGRPVPAELPSIAYSMPDEPPAHAGVAAATPARVIARYHPPSGTIYLPRNWTGATPAELSMLIHEMVHHFQAHSDEHFVCPAAREKDAYAAQERFLAMLGGDLETELGMNGLFLLVVTTCMF